MSGAVHTRYAGLAAFETKDGSAIRELMHPRTHAAQAQSLAEATVAPGATTRLHRHRVTEELYYIESGRGLMTLDAREFEVQAGDTVCIRPGTPHRISNIGDEPLRLLCCCSPAYRDQDTDLL
jgi:mannose-6-phosphate isomerase-like protein (cupin superfamily)